MGETECQSSGYVVLGIGWVLQEIREWAEVVHSRQNRRTSPTGHGLHGWDDPDHREREIEDARSTRDVGVGSKREDRPSSSSGKRMKTSASHEFQDQGQDEACETGFVRPEKFQFLEKWQNSNFDYKIVISVKNPKFIL